MKPNGQRACLYFGTFNPIHTGHLMIAQAVLNQAQLGIERVYFIPSGLSPHRSHENDLAEALHRLKMVRLATASNPRFYVLDDEVYKKTPSYTVETVEKLVEQGLVATPVPIIIGSDALARLKTWHRPKDLAQLVCFLQMPRPGVAFVTELQTDGHQLSLNTQTIDMPMLSLSSSWIRESIRQNGGNCSGLRYFLPEPVRQYIQENRLYV
jgi:nicotinate-nucleotide adenylyltransferase